jgi:hypothetical protein
VELDTEKDFLSCTQHGKETLPNFYQRFLQLKGKNLEVSNDQVITQSIKALQDEPLHNHLVRDWPKTCQNSMSSLQNSTSRRSRTSASLSSKGRLQSKTKLQCLATVIINAITPSLCTTSILMVASHQRTRKRILDHLRKKGTMQLSTRGLLITVSEVMHRDEAAVMAEAHTHSGLRTACFMAMKPTTIQKITPYSSSLQERWNKNPNSLRNNHHLVKSTIQCSGQLTTTNTLHLTLRYFRNNPTKTA